MSVDNKYIEAGGTEKPRLVVSAGSVLNAMTSLKFSLFIIILIVLSCVIGTLLPQGAYEVAQYTNKNPSSVHAMERLTSLGLTSVFSAKWFIALLGLLGAELVVCSYKRLLAIRSASGPARIRIYGTLFTHLSIIIILVGVVVRGGWSTKGYIELREGDTADQIVVDGALTKIPFVLHLADFDVERYPVEGQVQGDDKDVYFENLVVNWSEENVRLSFPVAVDVDNVVTPKPGSVSKTGPYTVRILKHITDFTIDMTTKEIKSRSDRMENPAIMVKVTGAGLSLEKWLFARYPDFNMHSGAGAQETKIPFTMSYEVFGKPAVKGRIKAFKSTLQIVDGGKVIREQLIKVNSPFSYGGYTIYQSGFNEEDLTWTSLQVVKDPSVPIVYTGFLLLTLGLLMVTYSRTISAPIAAQSV